MAGEDPAYIRWVKQQPCRMSMHDPCAFGIEAHHAGRRPGYAMKAHDDTCIPLCSRHHRCLHDYSGPFRSFGKERLRQWQDDQIAYTRERWRAYLRRMQ